MQIVPASEIPAGQDVPLDDLLKVYNTAREMEFLCEREDGIGLAAVQVGIPWKLFIMKKGKGVYEHWLNATYSPVGEEKSDSIEGCLSLRTELGDFRRFKVSRFKTVRVEGKRLVFHPGFSAEDAAVELSGLDAIVAQHEIDHQNQILISDSGQEMEIR